MNAQLIQKLIIILIIILPFVRTLDVMTILAAGKLNDAFIRIVGIYKQ